MSRSGATTVKLAFATCGCRCAAPSRVAAVGRARARAVSAQRSVPRTQIPVRGPRCAPACCAAPGRRLGVYGERAARLGLCTVARGSCHETCHLTGSRTDT